MRAAVLGSPISHSLSPALHRAAYAALGLAGWTYDAIECDEAGLPSLVAGCGPEWAGLSLTMPLKRAVLPLLDESEPMVGQVGAANTVVFAGGRRRGHNTDVPGMIAALAEAGLTGLATADRGRGHNADAPGMIAALAEAGLTGLATADRPGGAEPWAGPAAVPPGAAGAGPAAEAAPGTVLIVGGGATACSALAAARGLGAAGARVAVRDPGRAGDLTAAAERLGMAVTLTPFGGPEASPELLISTVPGGAADLYAQQVTHGDLRPRFVFDVVYHPWPTSLAVAAAKAGARVVGGFELLLHQAAGQVTLMTGRPAPLEAMRAVGLAALGS